jgi:transposase
LSDRTAANVVRSRMDWKYALRLAFPGLNFHSLVLAKLHKRLVAEEEQVLLDAILEH